MGLNKKRHTKAIVIAIVLSICAYVLVPFVTTPFEKNYTIEVENQDRMIALTFDDGPGDYTMQLLNGLNAEGIKASFFLLGKKIEGKEDVVKKMQSDGHLIGNHTYTHCTLFNTSAENYINELYQTDDEIERVTGEKPEFFRPPHGFCTGRKLNKIDKKAVLWSNDPADWKHQDAEYVYNYLMKNAEDGKIFLLHDTKQTTVEGVLNAISDLKEQGYSFVRVDELLCRNGDYLASGLAYRSCKYDKSPTYF